MLSKQVFRCFHSVVSAGEWNASHLQCCTLIFQLLNPRIGNLRDIHWRSYLSLGLQFEVQTNLPRGCLKPMKYRPMSSVNHVFCLWVPLSHPDFFREIFVRSGKMPSEPPKSWHWTCDKNSPIGSQLGNSLEIC